MLLILVVRRKCWFDLGNDRIRVFDPYLSFLRLLPNDPLQPRENAQAIFE
ncbi:MAG: hypothetical protein ACUVWX_00355 [Kiritimatiellia bacterium]